ncbi:hypothetical protein OIO90_006023 [Microbotryomycetes sp. JL221]|nr:hypothetical protein OIO90_006023 [Microbotryomycetes sp. JL221]
MHNPRRRTVTVVQWWLSQTFNEHKRGLSTSLRLRALDEPGLSQQDLTRDNLKRTSEADTSHGGEPQDRELSSSATVSQPVKSLTSSYDDLFKDLPPSAGSARAERAHGRPQPPAASETSPAQPSNRPRGMQRQRQFMPQHEGLSFIELLEKVLPERKLGQASGVHDPALAGMFDAAAAAAAGSQQALPSTQTATAREKVQQAVYRRIKRQIGTAKAQLDQHDIEKLDAARERMMQFDSDVELLRWSMRHVFGFELDLNMASVFPDVAVVAPRLPSDSVPAPGVPRAPMPNSNVDRESSHPAGPASPIYADLLLTLFKLLRDTYRSPHLALYVFQLACSSPYSYVKGCTTALYNEVLRTKWLEADIESVAIGLDEMRGAGVRIDDNTRALINDIGQAIKEDEDLAYARFDHERQGKREHNQGENESVTGASVSLDILPNGDLLSSEEEERIVGKMRLFSPRQIAAWSRMERIVQEHVEEALARSRA